MHSKSLIQFIPVVVNDLGILITSSKSPEEVQEDVEQLSDKQKYTFIKEHFTPSSHEYAYPSTPIGGKKRCFNSKWLKAYPWLVYSCALDGVFCKYCTLFVGNTLRQTSLALVNKPFHNWKKLNEKLECHSKCMYHAEAIKKAEQFLTTMEMPEKSISSRLDQERRKNIERNRKLVGIIAETVLLCGRQCIPLRGDNENLKEEGNPGNFLALLKAFSQHDSDLRVHLESPQYRNATYMSPQTQNEIIDIIGKKVIQKNLVEEVNRAKFFSILADEVTSHNQEQLALCVRFVDEKNEVREEFLEFLKLDRITGQSIANTIKQELQDIGLPITNVVGQGYDGASNMSSARVGVQKLIRDDAPLAVYTHCGGHCLNLVISHSCSLIAIQNTLDKLKTCYQFFKLSPKRNGLLSEIISANVELTLRRKPMLELCKTRWAERHSAYSRFYQGYVYIVKSLEQIAHGLHQDELDTYKQATWDNKSRQEAGSLLAGITSFDYIITFLTVYQLLSHLQGITVKLQSTTLDIMGAMTMVSKIVNVAVQVKVVLVGSTNPKGSRKYPKHNKNIFLS